MVPCLLFAVAGNQILVVDSNHDIDKESILYSLLARMFYRESIYHVSLRPSQLRCQHREGLIYLQKRLYSQDLVEPD